MCSLRKEDGASLDGPIIATSTSDYKGDKARVQQLVKKVRGFDWHQLVM